MTRTRTFSVAQRLIVCLCVLASCALLSSAPAFAKEVHVFKSSFGTAGSGAGQFDRPLGVAVNEVSHEVDVVDSGNGRVERFDASTLTFLGEFNGSLAPTGSFLEPTEIAVDNSDNPLDQSDGDVYVIDRGHGVIDKFESDGTYLGQLTGTQKAGGSFESFQSGAGAERTLEGIAVDPNGLLWVTVQIGPIYGFSDDLVNKLMLEVSTSFGGASEGLGVDQADNMYF